MESSNFRHFFLFFRPQRFYSKFFFAGDIKASCGIAKFNHKSPYIAFVLYETTGRFIAIGAIVDQTTILTAGKVIDRLNTPEKLLVLAGSLKPWWGEKSQVRKVREIRHGDYDAVLLKLQDDLVFNPIVGPIKLPKKFYKYHSPVFGKQVLVFGVPLSETRSYGEPVPKTKTYYASVSDAVHSDWDSCEFMHQDLERPFNNQVHYCIYPNDSFCHGSIGSPVVGVDTLGDDYIVGVVVSTACKSYSVIVKISYLDRWIRTNSRLAYFMIDPN